MYDFVNKSAKSSYVKIPDHYDPSVVYELNSFFHRIDFCQHTEKDIPMDVARDYEESTK